MNLAFIFYDFISKLYKVYTWANYFQSAGPKYESDTSSKASVFGDILFRIFPHLERLRISPYSVRMRQNTDQNNSKYEHF